MFRSSFERIRAPVVEEDFVPSVYSCDLCDEADGWTSESEVDIHKRVNHFAELKLLFGHPKVIICQVCFEQFREKKALIRHIKSVHLLSAEDAPRIERDIYICDHCTQVFFNKELLTVHVQYWHVRRGRGERGGRSGGRVRCPCCGRRFLLHKLWYHFQQRNLQSVSRCPLCLAACGSRARLARHLATDHRANYECTMCGYEGKSSAQFTRHVREQHSSPRDARAAPRGPAPRCFVRRRLDAASTVRARLLHGLKLPPCVRICILCRQVCGNMRQMVRHATRDHVAHQPEAKASFACACGELFPVRVLLKHHCFKLKGEHRALDTSQPTSTH